MNKIKNFNELLAERGKIENNIAEQKLHIKESLQQLSNKLEPFLYLLPVLGIFKRQPTNSFLKLVTSFGIDLFVRPGLPAKLASLTKFIASVFSKRNSSPPISIDKI